MNLHSILICLLAHSLGALPLIAQTADAKPPGTPSQIETPASPPQTNEDWRTFSTADVRDIFFNATVGFILFSVEGVTYRHEFDLSQNSTSTSVSAMAATLSELRRAKRFKVRIDPEYKATKAIPIADLVILYDELK
jgi:hypothetical protein